MFDHPAFDDHEEVIQAYDVASGLRTIIAIHDLTRGPALGGCRVWAYPNSADALTDALRLSRGMSYKAAMADLPLGGGKAVVLVDRPGAKTPEMFEALGRVIDGLNGRYIVAEDVGSSPADMLAARAHTRHVAGIAPEDGGAGDPSPATALGCFVGLKRTVAEVLDRDDLEGVHVAVQGLGNVGFALAQRLAEAGARLTVADINADTVPRAEKELGAASVAPDEIMTIEADVLSPNALGASLNKNTIPLLKVRAIVGGANNQLATPEDGDRLLGAGVLYAPDYIVNAGGLTYACGEYFSWESSEVDRRIEGIADRLAAIFARSKAEDKPTHVVSDAMAEDLFRPTKLEAAE